jgi:hypothetical protein
VRNPAVVAAGVVAQLGTREENVSPERSGRIRAVFRALHAAANEVGTAIVVVGFAMQEPIRSQVPYSAYCDTMQHLELFAQALREEPSGGAR